jgi:hypothetical protein
MAGANVSPTSTVAPVRSFVVEVKIPRPNPPEEIVMMLALAQLSFWQYANEEDSRNAIAGIYFKRAFLIRSTFSEQVDHTHSTNAVLVKRAYSCINCLYTGSL